MGDWSVCVPLEKTDASCPWNELSLEDVVRARRQLVCELVAQHVPCPFHLSSHELDADHINYRSRRRLPLNVGTPGLQQNRKVRVRVMIPLSESHDSRGSETDAHDHRA